MSGNVRLFKILSIITGILAILVTLGAVGMAAFMGLMLSGDAVDIVIAVWQSLSLGKYFFNAFLVLFTFFTFRSKAAANHYMVFLVPSLLLALWNYVAIPHKIAYGYFVFWMIYSVWVYLHRAPRTATDNVSAGKVDSHETADNPASNPESSPQSNPVNKNDSAAEVALSSD